MTNEFAQLRDRLSRIKPWAAVAVVMAVILAMYYLMLGFRYWQAVAQAPDLNQKVQNLLTITRSGLPDGEGLIAELEEQEALLEGVRSRFTYPVTDELISIISKTARDASVSLISVSMDSTMPLEVDNIEFTLQPVTITLQGETNSIFHFLGLMHERVPASEVAGIRLADLNKNNPTTLVHLVTYISPMDKAVDSGPAAPPASQRGQQ